MGTRIESPAIADRAPPSPRESDAVAILRSQSEPEAFVTLFERHFDAVHRFLHRRLGRDLADELAAEVFTQAYRRRRSFVASRESALPWLYGIAANLVRRHRRTELRRLRAYARTGVDASVELDDAHAVERIDAARIAPALADALAGLSPDDRETLTLVVLAELTYDEVGRALGVPTGTVASRMNRIRRQLVALLPDQLSSHQEDS